MNAVEIEEAVSALAELPFEAEEFPFALLQAFGNKATTIRRLRSGASNGSDLGGVLQRSNIHIKVCPEGEALATLAALKASPATARAKSRFVLSTDGREFHAEDMSSGDVVVCDYPDFPEHFGFFLPLAGITTVRQIRESAFDIKATGRLNRLYVELLKENPGWGAADRRHEMNHFMARLIFCFFAEDTQIFTGQDLFTGTIEQMSARDSSNTHEVIGEIFRAMNTEANARLGRWRSPLGGCLPVCERRALRRIDGRAAFQPDRALLSSPYRAPRLEEDQPGHLRFDDPGGRGRRGAWRARHALHQRAEHPEGAQPAVPRRSSREAGRGGCTNSRKLLNLRNRMARIRVFDPACGSGNFLVIAYKEMREIEAEINKRRRVRKTGGPTST